MNKETRCFNPSVPRGIHEANAGFVAGSAPGRTHERHSDQGNSICTLSAGVRLRRDARLADARKSIGALDLNHEAIASGGKSRARPTRADRSNDLNTGLQGLLKPPLNRLENVRFGRHGSLKQRGLRTLPPADFRTPSACAARPLNQHGGRARRHTRSHANVRTHTNPIPFVTLTSSPRLEPKAVASVISAHTHPARTPTPSLLPLATGCDQARRAQWRSQQRRKQLRRSDLSRYGSRRSSHCSEDPSRARLRAGTRIILLTPTQRSETACRCTSQAVFATGP